MGLDRPRYLYPEPAGVLTIYKAQIGANRSQCDLNDCESQTAAKHALMPAAKKTVCDLVEFFFGNARAFVLNGHHNFILTSLDEPPNKAVVTHMADGVFLQVSQCQRQEFSVRDDRGAA